jgi:hypothetical protein
MGSSPHFIFLGWEILKTQRLSSLTFPTLSGVFIIFLFFHLIRKLNIVQALPLLILILAVTTYWFRPMTYTATAALFQLLALSIA